MYDSSDLAGIASAVEYTISVPANSNYNFGEYQLIETDLTLLEPARESQLSDTPPRLSWEAYPGAAYYHLELSQQYGNYTNLEVDTTETYVDIELPLLDCTYGWDVTAYNDSGLPLARSDTAYEDSSDDFYQQYDGLFTIENASLPWCHLRLTFSRSGEQTTSGTVQLEWELHPLAVSYRLSISRDVYGHTYPIQIFAGSFVLQEDGSLSGPSLPSFDSGTYYWDVKAYTEDGGFIAGAESSFRIP